MCENGKPKLINGMLDLDELLKEKHAAPSYLTKKRPVNRLLKALFGDSDILNNDEKKELHMSMTNEQAEFALMLEKAPYIKHLWDLKERLFIPEKVEQYLATASHGDAIMARFFLGVWRRENEFDFDLFEAVKVLDQGNLKIIMDWMEKPLCP